MQTNTPPNVTDTPTIIYLIRHADVHNPQEIVYARLPRFGLSQIGFREAETTARYLVGISPLNFIYSSPMLRAKQTADIISWAQHPPTPVIISELINEVRTSWAGAANRELISGKINFYEPKRDPSDESIMDVYNRMYAQLNQILARHWGQTLAIVSHADPLMILKTGLRGIELRRDTIREPDYPAKASVSTLTFSVPDAPPQISYFDPNAEMHKRIEEEEKARRAAEGQPTDVSPSQAPAGAGEEYSALTVLG